MGKKILLITLSNISDHQDKVVVLFEEMRKVGHDVSLILPENIDVECEHSERTSFVKCPNRPGITKGTFNLKNLWQFKRIIDKGRFDYIIFETLHVWNLPIILFHKKKTKVIQMIHDVIPHGGDKSARQVALMNKVVCRFADKIIIFNEKYKESLCNSYKIQLDKIYTMNLWERYPQFNKPSRTGRMLFFGRLNPYKGADNLLQIIKLCPSIHFDIVGKPDSQVSNIICELKTLSNVSVDDRYVADSEIMSVFSNCEWVILPYNSATQSGVVVESYKYSKPVICFDVGAISEQVIDGNTGYLIPPQDIEGFATVVNKAISLSDSEYNHFCCNAFKYGHDLFAPDKAAKELDLICK